MWLAATRVFPGVTRPLCNDLGGGVGNVGICLDGQIVKGNSPPREQKNRNTENQDAIAQGKVDQVTNHFCCSAMAAANSSALITIS